VALSLLTYSRKNPQDKSWENINSLVISVYKLIGKDLRDSNIELVTDLDQVPDMYLAASRVQQLVLNLVLNAREAIGRNGRIIVSTKFENDMVILKIKDTGRGIPKDIMGRVFDPFFSTKGVWGGDYKSGSGLGLSICRNIVRDYGGEIQLSSAHGQGTTALVQIPVSDADWQDFVKLVQSADKSLVVMSVDEKTREHLMIVAVDYDKNLTIIESSRELNELKDSSPIVVLDAEFPGMGELYRAAEICTSQNINYIVVNTGYCSEYQMRGILDSARIRYVGLPGARQSLQELV
jgi:hypothetical protein